MASDVLRSRFKAPASKDEFLSAFKRLPDRRHLWLTASTWRLINPRPGRMTGPTQHAIGLSLNAQEILAGRRFQDHLLRTVLDVSPHTKALTVEYRFYYEDAELRGMVRRPTIATHLLQAAGRLLPLYRWFRRAL